MRWCAAKERCRCRQGKGLVSGRAVIGLNLAQCTAFCLRVLDPQLQYTALHGLGVAATLFVCRQSCSDIAGARAGWQICELLLTW